MTMKRWMRRSLAAALGLTLGWTAGGAITGTLPTQVKPALAGASCCPAEPATANVTPATQDKPAPAATPAVVAQAPVPPCCAVEKTADKSPDQKAPETCPMKTGCEPLADGSCPMTGATTQPATTAPAEAAAAGDGNESCDECPMARLRAARCEPDAGQRAAQQLVPSTAELPMFSSVMWVFGGLFVLALVLGPIFSSSKSSTGATHAGHDSNASGH